MIAIVREILDVEEQLQPLQRRRAELEEQLAPWINGDEITVKELTEAAGELKRLQQPTAPPPAEDVARVAPQSRMVQKANPLLCPFSGCNYEAMNADDLEDHVAGCMPNDAMVDDA